MHHRYIGLPDQRSLELLAELKGRWGKGRGGRKVETGGRSTHSDF